MPSNIVMPKTGADSNEAKLVRWLKKEGDKIAIGDTVAEIETDKVNMEVEAYSAGILHQILAPEGTTLAVGTAIAVLLKEGETAPAAAPTPTAAAGKSAAPASTAPAATPPATAGTPLVAATPAAAITTAAPAIPTISNGHGADARIKASPLARRMAQEFNLDLAAISGRGPAGRVVKADVEAAIQAGTAAVLAAPAALITEDAVIAGAGEQPATAVASSSELVPSIPVPLTSGSVPEGATVKELTRIQVTTGRRLSESKQQAPHFYITVEIDMAEALKLRATLNEKAGGAFKISVNDLVIKAAAWALGKHPRLNSSFRDGTLYLFDHVNMSIAVAVEDGLVSPVLRDVDRKSLGQIARDAKALIDRARNGKLRPDDLAEGTFTISNLGMYDIDNFIAIINPPQAAILAVGSVRQVPVVRKGEIVIGQILKASVSVDHRAADGAQGAQFLSEVRNALENPLLMAL